MTTPLIKHCNVNKECEECFPYYGKVPHSSFNFDLEGTINTNQILTHVIPFKQWKSYNFLPDINEGEDPKKAICGQYFCPACKNGQKDKIETFYKKYENS